MRLQTWKPQKIKEKLIGNHKETQNTLKIGGIFHFTRLVLNSKSHQLNGWLLNLKHFELHSDIWNHLFAARTPALDGSSPPLIRSSTSRTSEVRNLNNKTTMILVVIFVSYSLQWLPYHLFTIATEVVRIHGDKNGLGAKVFVIIIWICRIILFYTFNKRPLDSYAYPY